MTINLVRYQVAKRVLTMNPPVARAGDLLPVFGTGAAAYLMLHRMLNEGVLVRRSHGQYGLGECKGVLLPRSSELMSKSLQYLLDNDCDEGIATPVIAEGIFEATEEVRERLKRARAKGLAEVVTQGIGGVSLSFWRASKPLRDAHAELQVLRDAARLPS